MDEPKKLHFNPEDLIEGRIYAFKYGQERLYGKNIKTREDGRWPIFEVEGMGQFTVPIENVFAVWVDGKDIPPGVDPARPDFTGMETIHLEIVGEDPYGRNIVKPIDPGHVVIPAKEDDAETPMG